MSAKITRTSVKIGTVAAPRPAVGTGRASVRLLIVVLLLGLLGAFLARPAAAAAYLSSGSRALELARADATRADLLDQATQALKRSHDFNPTSPLALRRLAEAYQLRSQPDAAVEMLEAALALQPDSLLIRRDLAYAYVAAGSPGRAAPLMPELAGRQADASALGDIDVRFGNLGRAYSTYTQLIYERPEAPASLLVRAALTAAALGNHREAEQLLRASGVSVPPAFIQAAIAPDTSLNGRLGPSDLLVNGGPQNITAPALLVFHGEGWYGYEPGFGRWASTPAELLIFSAEPRDVELALYLQTLYEPGAPGGFGEKGVFDLLVNGAATGTLSAYSHVPALARLALPAGWSRVALRLQAGSFSPQKLDPKSGDPRSLSFNAVQVNIATLNP